MKIISRFLSSVMVLFVVIGCQSDNEQSQPTSPIQKLSIQKNNEMDPAPPDNNLQDPEIEGSQPTFQLPIDEFTDRWNAITQEFGSNLFISTIKKIDQNHGDEYEAKIKDGILLRIRVSNVDVAQISMEGPTQTIDERYLLISGWSQIYLLFNPEAELHMVDSLFHDLGIEPNANLQQHKNTPVLEGKFEYKIDQTEIGHQFTATHRI
ncbi:hypothetical protein GCM10008967_02470 [Bacillus carboniphilus]|uniref:Uncharacterized protein n=1 Tax=Bacillus carboniphilus TaxID=86663 RepID=A0ABP3FFU6_9BACI